jgi:hypothetical protein
MGILLKVTVCTGWVIDYRETFACEHAYPCGFFLRILVFTQNGNHQ